ncbi:MAG: glycogen-binding domain-containing protein [Gemmatimonadaceae bacterium]
MRLTRHLRIAALFAALAPNDAAAQPRSVTENERLHDISVDVGGLTLRRRAETWRNAVSVVPHWRAATDDGALYVGGAVSGTQNGYESAYGTLGLELTPQRSRAHPWDLAGTATVLSARETQAIGVATLRGRKHWMSDAQGAWVGLTLGGRTQDQTQFGSIAAEASVWRSIAPSTTFMVTASATHAGDFLYYEYADAPTAADLLATTAAASGAEFRVPHTARFGELAAAIRHTDRRVELSVDGRYRLGSAQALGGSAAVTGDIALWLTQRYALVGLVGRQLADPALGTATTMYASVGLRIAARSLGAARSNTAAPREPIPMRRPAVQHMGYGDKPAGVTNIREVVLDDAPDGAYLQLRISGEVVEVAGDFSGWQPLPMVQRNGLWRLPSHLPPGVYRFVVRVDGSEWRPAYGLHRMQDDFGGEVGVVTIR